MLPRHRVKVLITPDFHDPPVHAGFQVVPFFCFGDMVSGVVRTNDMVRVWVVFLALDQVILYSLWTDLMHGIVRASYQSGMHPDTSAELKSELLSDQCWQHSLN